MKITFIISNWNNVPICVNSLLEQKDPNWRAIVVHDGPENHPNYINDFRIEYYETPSRKNDTGDSTKVFGVSKLTDSDNLVVFTGMDNYYIPSFVGEMKAPFNNPKIKAAYCNCLHNYYNWSLLDTSLNFGQIDCGCFVVRAELARKIGWPCTGPASDWGMMREVINYNFPDTIVKVPLNLYVHN